MSTEPDGKGSGTRRRRLSLGHVLLAGGILLAVGLLVGVPLLIQGEETSSTGTLGEEQASEGPSRTPDSGSRTDQALEAFEPDRGEAVPPGGRDQGSGCEAFVPFFREIEPPFDSVDDLKVALDAIDRLAQGAPAEVAEEATIASDTFHELLDLDAEPARLAPDYFPEESLNDPAKVAEGIANFFQDHPDFARAGEVLQDYYDSHCAGARLAADEPTEATTREVSFNHPSWGDVRLVIEEPASPPGPATIKVYDRAGSVRWSYENELFYSLGLVGEGEYVPDFVDADPVDGPIDGTGHIFLTFNPGRYDGVIVLAPVSDGFESFETLPPSDGYDTRFYNAYAIDVDGDGVYEVDSLLIDCVPSCAESDITSTMFVWNGKDYVEETP